MTMKQITDYKEISPLILKYFKRGVITNNFLTSEDYKYEIAEERLFYNADDDYLNIYVKRDRFFQLYFHALSENVIFPEVDEMLICDIAGECGNVMKINGFSEYIKRVKLEIELEGEGELSDKKALKGDASAIYELMKKSFDKFTGYIPNFTQIEAECENGFFYKLEENGEIAGVLRSGKSGRTAQIKHLCVKEEYRGKGVGRILCGEFLKENKKAVVWTGKENAAAIGLYKSMGFVENKSESTVYMKG